MTVRDVYIFQSRDDAGPDVECDDPDAEVIADARYARRLRRSPLVSERSLRQAARDPPSKP